MTDETQGRYRRATTAQEKIRRFGWGIAFAIPYLAAAIVVSEVLRPHLSQNSMDLIGVGWVVVGLLLFGYLEWFVGTRD